MAGAFGTHRAGLGEVASPLQREALELLGVRL